jgi:hypothetical protein
MEKEIEGEDACLVLKESAKGKGLARGRVM